MSLPAQIATIQIERQVDGELRISDVEIAERLGYSRTRDFRRITKAHADLIDAMGGAHSVRAPSETDPAQTVTRYWYTEAQAIFLISRSDRPEATAIMAAIATAFVQMRREIQAVPLPELFRLAIINDQVRQWQKEYPDEFFHNLHRVLGLARPSIGNHSNCAHFINRFVYSFLFGKLGLSVIRDANPSDDEGSRAHRHHQVLKEKHLPKMRSHIEKIDGLLANATSLQHFEDMFTRAFPQPNTQIGFLFQAETPRLTHALHGSS